MGENKHIEELSAFTKKHIKDIEIETPSIDFTANIMETILKEEKTSVYKATPLISKKVWFVLASILAVSVLYVSKGASLNWLKVPEIKMDYLSNIQFPNFFEGFTISHTVLYTSFLFTVMIFIQIYVLKNHFTKHLNS
ncbi:hypothetical protein [Tenacibaculum caenipelagi]|uniref:Uncharacterized protein n=1 Tax=Tenacibaculum caenipelagi TaxID=1325435 RepID=A0A4R6THD2_9FLAO|nr:hypothetical protein [Tenacibaculum caenipelagi]TDQ29865.1 hypothetical protein DFQ07_0189 [Tenacibaculum caenipelagi]